MRCVARFHFCLKGMGTMHGPCEGHWFWHKKKAKGCPFAFNAIIVVEWAY